MILCMGIFLVMIIGFVFADKFHTTLGVVALLAIMLTAFSGLVEPKVVLANFANRYVHCFRGL